MALLVLGLVLFLGSHSVTLLAPDWRRRQIAARGQGAWKAAVALASLLGIGLIVWGYGLARAEPIVVWQPPVWSRHLATLLVLPAFVLAMAAVAPPGRIKAAVGHPLVLGVKVWAFAHLIANGTLADLALFGAILAWAVMAFALLRRRDRSDGRVAVAGPVRNDLIALAAGLAIWAIFLFWLHQWLIGVRPI